MKKIYILPNLVTTGNMFCGFYAIILATRGAFVHAAWMILLATIFDSLDGRIARMARATSSFGVEYDSLSDLVSFGVAPAVLMYTASLETVDRLGWVVAFLFLACGALRLARFNVSVASVSKNFFQGLPIPMGAGVIATFFIFRESTIWGGYYILLDYRFVLVMSICVSLLMVSTLPFPSFKEVHWRSRASFGYLLLGVAAMLFIAASPETNLFLVLNIYIFSSMGWYFFRKLSRRRIVAESAASSKPGTPT